MILCRLFVLDHNRVSFLIVCKIILLIKLSYRSENLTDKLKFYNSLDENESVTVFSLLFG